MLKPTKKQIPYWVAAIGALNAPFYEIMPHYKAPQWVELVYNIACVFFIFYIAANLMACFYNKLSRHRYSKLSYAKKVAHNFTNKYILAIVFCIIADAVMYHILDDTYFGRHTPLRMIFYRRITIIGGFVVAGMYYARDKWKDEKTAIVITSLKMQNHQLRTRVNIIKELYNTIKKGLTG